MRTAIAVILMTRVAVAQPASPSAATALANVEKFYATANQLTAQFREVVTHGAFGTATTTSGKLWVARPSSMRWDYVQKAASGVIPSKTFVVSGKALWYIDHGNKQITKSQLQQSALPAAVAFLTGASSLSSQFTVTIAETGANTMVLELVPKQPSAPYQRLWFHVDTRDWHVTESSVVATNGETSDFSFFAPNLATPVNASLFVVNPASLPAYQLVIRP